VRGPNQSCPAWDNSVSPLFNIIVSQSRLPAAEIAGVVFARRLVPQETGPSRDIFSGRLILSPKTVTAAGRRITAQSSLGSYPGRQAGRPLSNVVGERDKPYPSMDRTEIVDPACLGPYFTRGNAHGRGVFHVNELAGISTSTLRRSTGGYGRRVFQRIRSVGRGGSPGRISFG